MHIPPRILRQVKEFKGHSARVLHMQKSPDGNTICTAGADEMMMFWGMCSNNSRSSSSHSISNNLNKSHSATSSSSSPALEGGESKNVIILTKTISPNYMTIR